MRVHPLQLVGCLVLACTLAGAVVGEPPAGRVPGTIRLAGDPDGLAPYRIVPAFPHLRFRRPLYLRMARTDDKGMPNLAHNRVDDVALERVARWIRSLR